MTAATVNLTIEQGTTFERVLTLTDSDGEVYDLTGYTARAHFRANINDVVKILELTTENGGLTISAALGIIEMNITAAATAALTADGGVWDLEIISGVTVTRVLAGAFTVSKEVTR